MSLTTKDWVKVGTASKSPAEAVCLLAAFYCFFYVGIPRLSLPPSLSLSAVCRCHTFMMKKEKKHLVFTSPLAS